MIGAFKITNYLPSALRLVCHVFFLGFAFIIWEVSVAENARMAFVFGQPSRIISEFSSLLYSGELIEHIVATLSAALIGWLFGTILGTGCGLLLASSRKAFRFVEPYVLFLGSLPVFALGPLLVFWFGTGLMSKIVLVLIATYAISLIQAFNGALNVNTKLLDVMRVHDATSWQVTRYVRAPSAVLWVIAGLRINIGMALIGAVIGEFIASRHGLGHLIIEGEGLYNMNRIWVGVLCISLLAIALNTAVSAVEKLASSYSSHIQVDNRP